MFFFFLVYFSTFFLNCFKVEKAKISKDLDTICVNPIVIDLNNETIDVYKSLKVQNYSNRK